MLSFFFWSGITIVRLLGKCVSFIPIRSVCCVTGVFFLFQGTRINRAKCPNGCIFAATAEWTKRCNYKKGSQSAFLFQWCSYVSILLQFWQIFFPLVCLFLFSTYSVCMMDGGLCFFWFILHVYLHLLVVMQLARIVIWHSFSPWYVISNLD